MDVYQMNVIYSLVGGHTHVCMHMHTHTHIHTHTHTHTHTLTLWTKAISRKTSWYILTSKNQALYVL